MLLCNTKSVKNVLRLLAAFLLCFSVAYAGSAVTMPAIGEWYATLQKPPFNPPNAVFGPVWTMLYSFMAIALFLVWNTKAERTKKESAYRIFYIQLFLNLLWSITFFGLQQPLLGLVVIILLWISIKKTIQAFLPIKKAAGYLFYPYLAWVSFAALLNFSIAVLNF